MNMDRKTLITALACLFCLFAGTASASLPEYAETIVPNGSDGALTAVWRWDEAKDRALLPVPAKSRLGGVTVSGAEAGKPEITVINEEEVLLVPLSSVNGPVEVNAAWDMPGLFKPKVPGSGRGDLTPIRHSIRNSTGIGFASAAVELSLPKDMRLFQVAGDDPKFHEEGGVYTVTRKASGKKGAPGLAAGAKLDLNVTMMPPPGNGAVVLWAFAAIISALCLYFRRDLMPGRRKDGNA